MSTGPIKLFAFVGVAAVIVAGMLSQHFQPELPQQAAAQPSAPRPAPGGSRSGGLFDNLEFRRGPASAPQPVTPQPVSSRSASVAPPAAQPQPVAAAPASAARGFGTVAIKRDAGGHYQAQIEIDGQRVSMLVDTGATIVALRSEDAQKLGLNPPQSDYTAKISTANGEIAAARVTLREVRLENIAVTNVQAVIMPPGALGQSLLGMSFMNKLAKFEIADGELVLRP